MAGATRRKMERSRISWKSVAWSEQPMGREGKQPKENENNSSSVPTTQAPRSRIFVILLGSWFVFIFWENQTVADKRSLLSARSGAKLVVGYLGRALRLWWLLFLFSSPPAPFYGSPLVFLSHLLQGYVALLRFMCPCEWL